MGLAAKIGHRSFHAGRPILAPRHPRRCVLSNYAYINLNDPIGRSYGVGRSEVFGAASMPCGSG